MNKEKELNNFYYRILFVAVTSVVAARTLHFVAPNFIAIMATNLIVGIKKYKAKVILFALLSMYFGMGAGLITSEIFVAFPILHVLLTYTIFLTAVKLFSHDVMVIPAKVFIKGYALGTTSASYLSKNYEVQFGQNALEFLIAFIILTVGFKLFPGNVETQRKQPLEKSKFFNYELYYFAFIMTSVWCVFMLFRFDFANLALLTLFNVFVATDFQGMREIGLKGIVDNFFACFVTALFSMVLFGMIGNIILLILGLLLIFIPLAYHGIYKGEPKALSKIPRFMTPMCMYLNTEGAAVYKVALRATTVIVLMSIAIFLISLLPKNNEG
jgi:hypothetical protein